MRWTRLAAALAVGALLAAGCSSHRRATPPASAAAPASTSADPASLATQAYLFGYPLVVSARTFGLLGRALGVNTLRNQQALSDVNSRVVVAPNADTLYSVATIDLRSGPVVLRVPDVLDRYWTYQFLDMWTDSFAYIGTRATGGHGGTFVIAPPGWTGSPPPGATVITSPTPRLFLLGRFLARGQADVPNVDAITAQVSLEPLDPAQPPANPPPPPAGSAQSVATAGIGFFDELDDAVAIDAPTTDAQRDLLTQLAPLGIGPGRHPSTELTDPASRRTLTDAIAAGEAQMQAGPAQATLRNGWSVDLHTGTYGDDLLARATVAKFGWGANIPAEGVYARATADENRHPLDGSTRYRIHFDAADLPPVDGFWSVTVYGPDGFLTANPINRYALGSDTPGLATNPDGSLDLLLQHDPPAPTSNWLPTPAGPFTLSLRLYLPRPPILDGSNQPPPVQSLG